MLDNETDRTVDLLVRGGRPLVGTRSEEIDDGSTANETHGGGGSGKGRAEKGPLESLLEEIDDLKKLPFNDTHGGGGSGKG